MLGRAMAGVLPRGLWEKEEGRQGCGGGARPGDYGAESGIEASRVWKNWGMLAEGISGRNS